MRFVGISGLVGSAALLGACGGGGDTPPVGPVVLSCPTAAVPLCTDATGATNVRAALTDAVTRLRPSLGTTVSAAVAPELTVLKTAVDAGSITAARSSAERLRVSLTAARGNGILTPDLVTIDAITLAIISVQVALGVTPVQLSTSASDIAATS